MMRALRLVTLLAGMFFAASSGALAYVVYGPTINAIWGINPVSGSATKVYTFASPMTSIAAIAQRQSDGMIFFIDGNTGNNNVYRWDPSTPSTAPVLLGTTGTGVPYLPRLAFDTASGVLYAMDTNANPTIWTINTSTGAATSTGTSVSGLPSGGGDFVIDTDGTWYIAVGNTLYKTAGMGGTPTTIGTVSSTGTITGLALGAGNTLVGSDSSTPSKVYLIDKTTATATNTNNTINDTASVGDLAGIFQSDLQLTKTDDSGGSWTAGLTGNYTLTITNIGNKTTSGTMTLTDAVPSGSTGLTVKSVTAAVGWTCTTSQTVTCTSNSGTTLAPNASATFTINITVSGSETSVTNSASVTGGGVPSNLAPDGQASDTTAITQGSSGTVYIGPYVAADTFLGAQFSGSYDGIVASTNQSDFSATNIPFAAGTALNNGPNATATTPDPQPVTAASVTFNVANSLYYTNTGNSARTLTIAATLPSGWTGQICPDNAGAPLCTGTTTGTCTTTTWNVGGFSQTPSSSCTEVKHTSSANVRFWLVYTTPASGLMSLTRYDSVIQATDTGGNANATHNELYSGYIAVAKTVTAQAPGCPAGMTPAYASGVCPGGVLLYAISYKNIIVGSNSASGAAMPSMQAGSFVITENGSSGSNNWATYTNGLKEALVAGADGSTTFGDSTSGSTFAGNTVGSTSFTCKVGGASFQLAPGASGTLWFRVVVK